MKTREDYFVCHECGEAISTTPAGYFTPGYGTDNEGNKVCYSCCAKEDAKTMQETGKYYLYFTGDKVTNWPGSLSFPVYYKKTSWHNMAGRNGRTDFWFMAFGKTWHGVLIGHHNQCARVTATKGR